MLYFYGGNVKKGHAVYELCGTDGGEHSRLLDVNTEFLRITRLDMDYVSECTLREMFLCLGLDWSVYCGLFLKESVNEGTVLTEGICLFDIRMKLHVYVQEAYLIMDIYPEDTDHKNTIRHAGYYEENLFMNSTQDALFIVVYIEGEFRYLRSNRNHQKVTGLTLKDIAGRTPAEVLGPEDGARHERIFRTCIDTGKAQQFEESLVFQGKKMDFYTKVSPYFKEGVWNLVVSRIDITKLKESLNTTGELLLRFQSLFYKHSACMLMIEPDTGDILDANPAALSFYGYSREEITSMKISDINCMTKSDVSKHLNMAKGKEQIYFRFRHRLKNGEVRFVDAYASPIEVDGRIMIYSIVVDATEKETALSELSAEKELMRVTLESMTEAVITLDQNGRVLRVNHMAVHLLQKDESEIIGHEIQSVIRIVHGETRESLLESILCGVANGMEHRDDGNYFLIQTDGNSLAIEENTSPIRDEYDNLSGAVMILRDVSIQKQERREINYLSYHDPLTGVYNRGFYNKECLRLDEDRNLKVGILIGDVNGLKIINDVFGHTYGDQLLCSAASIIDQEIHKEHYTFRWGGDEFVSLIPGADLAYLEEVVKNMIKRMQNHRIQDLVEISVAFGYAVRDNSIQTVDEVLQKAEEHMYRRKMTESRKLKKEIVRSVLDTVYKSSEETRDHAQRLATHLLSVGKSMKLPDSTLQDLKLLATLHDIGKVGVPTEILMKQGSLTEEERESIKKHSEIGYRIALNIPEIGGVADAILSHHERWDGTGYPQGLKAHQIPVEARILAVADAFDAMTNNRAYRKALSVESALQEIQKNSGTQFDPEIVQVFLGTVHAKGKA